MTYWRNRFKLMCHHDTNAWTIKKTRKAFATYGRIEFLLYSDTSTLVSINNKIYILLIQYCQLPFICGNIPSAPAYGVFISQLLHYAIVCRIILLLQLGFCNRVMLLKYWIHHTRFVVVIINSWIVTSICSMRTDLFTVS